MTQFSDERREELVDRIEAAQHAIQSGIAMDIERGSDASTPKHLRVGVDTAKAEHAGLAQLLIDKGLITEQEYYETTADALEKEQRRYEAYLSRQLGAKVTLR